MLLCACVAKAEDLKWALQTQDGQSVFMNQVGYILYSDGSSAMSIVKTDNSTIEDVTKVTFVQLDATGISQTVKESDITVLSRVVEENLTVTGCAEGLPITIVTASGAVAIKSMTSGDRTSVDVSRLASGVYVLRVGKTAVKFIKK